MAKRAKKKADRRPKEVAFEYIKSAHFRPIAADGAFGGLAPNGRSIHMALFNERRPLPRKTVHDLSRAGHMGEELRNKRESRQGYVREVEVDVVMDLQTALVVRKWITERILEMAKILNIEIDLETGEMQPITATNPTARNTK